ASRSVCANSLSPWYQCRLICPLLTLCQWWSASSQVIVLFSDVTSPLSLPVTRQRYQIRAPGGSEPDLCMSQVHSTFADVPRVKLGKALPLTSPQVASSTPYSSATCLMPAGTRTPALKVISFGNRTLVPWSSISA